MTVPLNTRLAPVELVMVSVELMEFADRASGVVMAVELRVMVAEVLLTWVAVSVAVPPPKMPQAAVMVAELGVTAADAEGAKASVVAAMTPAVSAAPVAKRFMGIVFPSRWWECHVWDGDPGPGGCGHTAGDRI